MISSDEMIVITAKVNGESISAPASVRRSLVDWLRHDVGFTGSHVGCEHGVCGACNVVVDGRVVRGCLMLAVQANGLSIQTIEDTSCSVVKALQEAFFARAALQCGFCTPGMIIQAAELLRSETSPSREKIRETLSGNYCRCTGYHAIVDAVEAASRALQASV